MSTAVIILQPWDEYPRPFTVIQNGEVIFSKEVAKTTLTVEGKITIKWGGWFAPDGTQVSCDEYSFNTSSCNGDEQINLHYKKIDPSKPDSVVVQCTTTPTTTQPPTLTTTTQPLITTTTQPPTTTTQSPTTTEQPPTTTTTQPSTTQPTVTPTSAVVDSTTTQVSQVPVVSSIETLPFTGAYHVAGLITIGVVFCAVGLAITRLWKKNEKPN